MISVAKGIFAKPRFLQSQFPLNHDGDGAGCPAVNTSDPHLEDALAWKQIVAKAVHDIRTPLSCVRTTLEILRMLPADSEQHRRMVGVIDTQVDQISGQLERLLVSPESYMSSTSEAGNRE